MTWWINEEALAITEKEFWRADVEAVIWRGFDGELEDDELWIFEFYLANCREFADEEEEELDQSVAASGF